MNINMNPYQKNLSISVPSYLEDIATVEIQNDTGDTVFQKKILSDGEIKLDNLSLTKGMYIVKVVKGDKIFKKGLSV